MLIISNNLLTIIHSNLLFVKSSGAGGDSGGGWQWIIGDNEW
jgi:hypothetical protein